MTDHNPDVREGGFFGRPLFITETIHSIALSHEDCDCLICRAADGDKDAYITILTSVLIASDQER